MAQCSAPALANKINRALQGFPQHIRDFYNGNLKFKKGAAASKTKEFVEALMSGEGMMNPYFKQLERTIHSTNEEKASTWLSWRSVTSVEGESVIALAIVQGRIITRPSEHLDHNDVRTSEIDPKEQLEYKTEEVEIVNTGKWRLSTQRKWWSAPLIQCQR